MKDEGGAFVVFLPVVFSLFRAATDGSNFFLELAAVMEYAVRHFFPSADIVSFLLYMMAPADPVDRSWEFFIKEERKGRRTAARSIRVLF